MNQTRLDPAPLRSLVGALDVLFRQEIADDAVVCAIIAKRLRRVLDGDWLPEGARVGSSDHYQRHVLHEDPRGRFSIGAFVWGAGQATPIHDHTSWGVIGVMAGDLISENFEKDARGNLSLTSMATLGVAATTWLSPRTGDIHRVVNPSRHAAAISLHVYGAPFAAVCRERYDAPDAAADAGRGAARAPAARP